MNDRSFPAGPALDGDGGGTGTVVGEAAQVVAVPAAVGVGV